MVNKKKRTAFFISDGTGITAGSLGGLLSHFPETDFDQIRIPFTNSSTKIDDAQKRIVNAKLKDGEKPIVIMTIGDPDLCSDLKQVDAYYIDLFDVFIHPLAEELGEITVKQMKNVEKVYENELNQMNFNILKSL